MVYISIMNALLFGTHYKCETNYQAYFNLNIMLVRKKFIVMVDIHWIKASGNPVVTKITNCKWHANK